MMHSMRKRSFAAAVALGAALAAFAAPAEERSRPNPFQKDEVDRALEKAVAYLISRQGEDGSISANSRGRKRDQPVDTNSTAMTSLAIMAIASVGNEAGDQTPEGEVLRKALDCVLEPRRQKPDGYFGGADGSRMYGHGITTLMLAEMLGMGLNDAQDTRVRASLKLALELIMRTQKIPRGDQRYKGGWRYEPAANDADLSVTVWQVMALRSAKNAGLDIAKDVIDEAAEYIRRSYPSYRSDQPNTELPPGAFSYQPGGTGTYSTGAAGLLALQVCGSYDDRTVKGTADWLLKNKPRWDVQWFFYGTYYYAQGMFQRGGAHAEEGRKNVCAILLAHQEKQGEHAGSWLSNDGQEQNAGRVYSTSLGILSLSVKYHYLPIYQR
jgi:hypothetical protein